MATVWRSSILKVTRRTNPAAGRLASAIAGCRSSTCPPLAPSRWPTTVPTGSRTTVRSTTSSSCARSWASSATSSARAATPRCCSPPTPNGDSTRSSGCAVCGASSCSTFANAASSCRGIASASNRCICCAAQTWLRSYPNRSSSPPCRRCARTMTSCCLTCRPDTKSAARRSSRMSSRSPPARR